MIQKNIVLMNIASAWQYIFIMWMEIIIFQYNGGLLNVLNLLRIWEKTLGTCGP